MDVKLTIICCIYNELNILNKKFKFIRNQLQKSSLYHEIIFVDNNSSDGSKEYLLDLKKKIELKEVSIFLIIITLEKGVQ